jgi:iduronate 2-sulfatase
MRTVCEDVIISHAFVIQPHGSLRQNPVCFCSMTGLEEGRATSIMKRLSLVFTCIALVAAAATAMAAETPHILFIAVDDLRPQLGCYGEKQMISPNIDRLAAEGVRFSRAYCQVPVCGASRASLMTGLRPTPKRFVNYHTRADKDAPGVVDLPSWLKKQGYDTYSMGKIYHHNTDNRNSWTVLGSKLIRRPGFKDYHLRESRSPKGAKGWGGGAAYEAADLPEQDYFQWQLADAAIDRLKQMKKAGKPSFLAVGFTKPHLPFVAPKKYWDLYKRDDLMLATNPFRPKGAPDQALHNFGELRSYKDIPQGKAPVPPELALTLKHGYYACVSYTDAMIGRILEELDRLDMRKDTIIVLWGDHGWQLGEHGLWCKHSNFNTSLNAPLIVSAPGRTQGSGSSALVEFVDIYPTLCELAGVPEPEHLEGTSFVPLLDAPARPWKRAVFARYHAGCSVRTDRYLYTHWSRKGKVSARMLYDHQEDPMENLNLAVDPEFSHVVSEMEHLLAAHWKPVASALVGEPK